MESTPAKLHPLLTIAAISVTAASLAAIGVMTGILPGKSAEPTVPAAAPSAQTAVAASSPTPEPAAKPKPESRPAPPAPRKIAANANTSRHEPPAPPSDYRPAAIATPTSTPLSPPPAPPVCRDCGTVESVHAVTQQGEGTGLGAVAGGVLGGVVGHQVGRGRGNDLATVLGAVGGAVAGHQVEKNQRRTTHYEITVRMDDGTSQILRAESQPPWYGGERVRVNNGTALPL